MRLVTLLPILAGVSALGAQSFLSFIPISKRIFSTSFAKTLAELVLESFPTFKHLPAVREKTIRLFTELSSRQSGAKLIRC